MIVIQNAENPGPSDQKFSKPSLKELDEAHELKFLTTALIQEFPDSTNSISTIPSLARMANRAILPKFPDLARFWYLPF